MQISAVQKFTMLDYPGKIACIIFMAGCNFRCGYCHNSEFVLPEKIEKIKSSFIDQEIVLNFLKTRVGKLQGVVISGGEPTLQKNLYEFIQKVKSMGFYVKLDTNGTNPGVLKNLLENNLLNYIAIDFKTSFDNYESLCKNRFAEKLIKETLKIIKNSEIEYELRCTLIKEIHTQDVLKKMADEITSIGLENTKFYVQKFRPQETLDKSFQRYTQFSKKEINQKVVKIFNDYNINVIQR